MKLPKINEDIENYDISDPLCPWCKGVGWMRKAEPTKPWDQNPQTSTGPGVACKCNPLSGHGTILN